MCGILGTLSFKDQISNPDLISSMSELIRHRGPDSDGNFIDESNKVALGFRRLAILDLSEAGKQPMASEDGRYFLVFNGEIYNHNELRSELVTLGYTFRSSTDSEVILAAYQEWGTNCLQKFNGMWGLAIWDKNKEELFCARDRFGIKPLYYHQNSNRLIFASEIKALFTDPETPCKPNERSVYAYLAFQQVQFGKDTFFEEIKQLLPSHFMLVSKNGTKIQKYWDINFENFQSQISDSDAIEGFRNLFFDSVRLRLQGDVPVGTCLSGGLDSSAIVGVANKIITTEDKNSRGINIGDKQKTFSACYEDKRFDERQWIKPVIDFTGAESNYIFPRGIGLITDLEKMLWHQEEPVAGSSLYAQWCVMRDAKEKGVTVMLDGQGGDEVMGGYQRYYWRHLAGLLRGSEYKKLVAILREENAGTMKKKGVKDIAGILISALPHNAQAQATFLRRGKQPWLGQGLREQLNYRPSLKTSLHPTWLGQHLYSDIYATCLPALLKYEDRSSMAHSIEARVPFLDHRLVEYMINLPDHLKIRDGNMKWLLRTALKDELPIEIKQRRNKIGFGTPETTWFKEHWEQVSKYLNQQLTVDNGWLNPKEAKTLLKSPENFSNYDSHFMWRWLNLEIWLKQIKENRMQTP